MLRGQIALVTGASRGIGRGIALQLGEAGATVYITGREPKKSNNPSDVSPLQKTANEITERGGKGIAAYCDHSNPDDVKRLFEKIEKEQQGQLDILVNNAYSAVDSLIDEGGQKFWELDPLFWDDVNNVGLRNHYICSVYAARLMIPRKKGLIVIVSSFGGLKYLFNVAYGVGKAACDRLAADIAVELKRHNITAISLWPGAVRTETIQAKLKDVQFKNFASAEVFEEGESTEFSGRAVAHLAADKNQIAKTGRILVTADLADEYGFTDIDGRHPPCFRSLKYLLKWAKYEKTAALVPSWIKLPGWFITASASKL